MLKIKNEDEEEDPDVDDKMTYVASPTALVSNPVSSRKVVELSDDEDVEIKLFTGALIQKRFRESGVPEALTIDPLVELSYVQTYTVRIRVLCVVVAACMYFVDVVSQNTYDHE